MYLQIHKETTSKACGQNTEFLSGRSLGVYFQSVLFNKTVSCYDHKGFMVQEGERAAMAQ